MQERPFLPTRLLLGFFRFWLFVVGLFKVGCFPDRGRSYGSKVNKQNILQEANLHRNNICKVRLEFLVTKGKVKV